MTSKPTVQDELKRLKHFMNNNNSEGNANLRYVLWELINVLIDMQHEAAPAVDAQNKEKDQALRASLDLLRGVKGYWTTSNDCLPTEETVDEAIAQIEAVLEGGE
jgi:hypothetical protein